MQFTENFAHIWEFKKVQLWTEKTALWKVLWAIGFPNIVKEKPNFVCTAIATYPHWRNTQLRTPYVQKLVMWTQQEIFEHLNNSQTRIVTMDLMSSKELDEFHQIEREIYNQHSITK